MVYQWTYAKTKSRFSQNMLEEYAGCKMDCLPFFRTVGIDHFCYRLAPQCWASRS
ncbi:MAG: hypothetical protein ABI988_14630 [Nitrospirota bacterium]